MILIVDNYDSFVHNLARYVREAGFATQVVRNDVMSAGDMLSLQPDAVIVSPGPNAPAEAGVSLRLIDMLPEETPFLGVCLGHQCLIEAFGGRTRRAKEPLHGEASVIRHDGSDLFNAIPNPFLAGRYHSLVGDLGAASDLIASAWSDADEVMAVRRRSAPWYGVQFHPESILTPDGRTLISNFLARVAEQDR
ncbi:MAG: aminodeoxychorismate/anthranilate synthase component II [Parvularculaceae bacterium]|nr:aminodeoxychorismate/anthranilate synthase component II [Parvularculaceae bacterium]